MSHSPGPSAPSAPSEGSIISRLYTWFATTFPNTRRFLWHKVYEVLAMLNTRSEWTLMNYGWAEADDTARARTVEEAEQLCKALYSEVIGHRPLAGCDVLEVGCGYGGGARHLTTTFEPKSYTGLDFAEGAIDLASKEHADVEALRFVHGDALDLPFPANSFDVLVNVESSHCYPSTPRFFDEVARVLRPNGLFCWTDIRHGAQFKEVDPAMKSAGMEIIRSENITANVLAAMDKMSETRLGIVERHLPKLFSNIGHDFAGTEGSNIHTTLTNGHTRYMLRTARLPEADELR